MVQDIIIRAEFLIEDLRNNIVNERGVFHPHIVKVYQSEIKTLIESGMEYDDCMIYNFNTKEDLLECIDMGIDAEDIAYLVNQYKDNEEYTSFFTCHGCCLLLSIQEVINLISAQLENIAYNVLKYPYKDSYAELYKEFVVPMIDNQK